MMISVAGCASGTNNYCLIASPIHPSNADIDIISIELAKKIETHDTTYEKLCKPKQE